MYGKSSKCSITPIDKVFRTFFSINVMTVTFFPTCREVKDSEEGRVSRR